MSQDELGRLVLHSGDMISKVEKAARWPTLELARRCDQALDTGGALVRLWPAVQRQQITSRPIRRPQFAEPVVPWLSESDKDHSPPGTVGQHDLLIDIARVARAFGLLGVEYSRRLGAADVIRMGAVTAMYRSLDYEHGGGLLHIHVAQFAESASGLVDCSFSESMRPLLLAAIAEARQLAGWTAFDAGLHSDALRHWMSAERAAVAAGDVRLAARIRYCQAKQFQHLRHNRDAIDTIRLARDHLGTAATAAISAMLDGAEAASHGAIGDTRQARACLDRAHRAFDQIDPEREPNWMGFFDRGEMLAQYGRVYRDMARADRRNGPDAVHWVSQAVQAFGPQNVRSTVLNEVGLCSALFLAGDPEQAVAVGMRVIDRARGLTSTRVLDRIRNVRRDLGDFAKRDDTREFGRAIATLEPALP